MWTVLWMTLDVENPMASFWSSSQELTVQKILYVHFLMKLFIHINKPYVNGIFQRIIL